MRFYSQQHRFYAGIDLHARTLHLSVLDQAAKVLLDKNLAEEKDALRAVERIATRVSKEKAAATV